MRARADESKGEKKLRRAEKRKISERQTRNKRGETRTHTKRREMDARVVFKPEKRHGKRHRKRQRRGEIASERQENKSNMTL